MLMDFDLALIPNTLAAVVLFVVAVVVVYDHERRRKKLNSTVPEAPGAWPLLGHLPKLAGPETPQEILGAIADKIGPVFTIRLGIHTAVVVSSPEVVKEIFTANDMAVSTRPSLFAVQNMCYGHAMFGFASYGPFWREMRKMATVELLSNKQVEVGRQARESEAMAWVKQIYKASQNNGGLVDMKKLLGDVVFNIMIQAVAGKKYGGGEEDEARRFREAIRGFVSMLGAFPLSDAVPFLGWMDRRGHDKAMKKIAKEVEEIVSGWLEEHKRKRAAARHDGAVEVPGGGTDFMNIILSLLGDSGTVEGLHGDTVNKATALNLITGGSDTTHATLMSTLRVLLRHPEKLEKVQEEIDIHVGKERLVQESDIPKLVYLQAIVKETMRLFPSGTLGGPRELLQECTIGGQPFPKGTRLIVNVWKIQRDPEVWEDPLEFKPERFLLGRSKEVDVMGKHFELLPFGAGRRGCPGMVLGLRVSHLVLASFLQAFNFAHHHDNIIDAVDKIQVSVSPRLPPRLLF